MGNVALRNHFWPLESRFLISKSEKKGPNSKPPLSPDFDLLDSYSTHYHVPILRVSLHFPATSVQQVSQISYTIFSISVYNYKPKTPKPHYQFWIWNKNYN